MLSFLMCNDSNFNHSFTCAAGVSWAKVGIGEHSLRSGSGSGTPLTPDGVGDTSLVGCARVATGDIGSSSCGGDVTLSSVRAKDFLLAALTRLVELSETGTRWV